MKYLLAIIIMTMSALCLAGATGGSEVVVGQSYASGSLSAARTSADSEQYIGCDVTSNDGYGSIDHSGTIGGCLVRDANGVTASCYTEDPALLKAMAATSGAAYIQFAWDENGNCTNIYTGISSIMID